MPEVIEPLTAEETARLQALENRVRQGEQDCALALREIRGSNPKLYREFGTFDDYVEKKFHRTRVWATQQIHRLNLIEALKKAELSDKPIYQEAGETVWDIPLSDAQQLKKLQEHPDLVVRAIKAAEGATDKKHATAIKEAVEGLLSIAKLRDNLRKAFEEEDPDGETQEAPTLSPEEEDALFKLEGLERSEGLIEQARGLVTPDKPLPVALVEVCSEEEAFPEAWELVLEARGTALLELVQPLLTLAKEAEDKAKIEADIEAEEVKIKKSEKKKAALQQKLAPPAAQQQQQPEGDHQDDEDEETPVGHGESVTTPAEVELTQEEVEAVGSSLTDWATALLFIPPNTVQGHWASEKIWEIVSSENGKVSIFSEAQAVRLSEVSGLPLLIAQPYQEVRNPVRRAVKHEEILAAAKRLGVKPQHKLRELFEEVRVEVESTQPAAAEAAG